MAATEENIDEMVSSDEIRPCQSCGYLVRMEALKCRYCGMMLAGGESLSQLVARVAEKMRRTQEQAERGTLLPENAPRFGRKIRWMTIVFLVISAWLTHLAVETVSVNSNPVFTFGVVLIALMIVPVGLFSLYDDIRVPSDSARTEPLAGFKAFMLSMCVRRWDYAWSCVLPADEDDRPRARLPIPRCGIKGGAFKLHSSKDLKVYWRPVILGWQVYNRALTVREWNVRVVDENNAVASCRYLLPPEAYMLAFIVLFPLSLVLLPLFNLCFDREEMVISKHMVKVAGKWYVSCSDIHSGEDVLLWLYPDGPEPLLRGELPDPQVMRQAGIGPEV